MRCSQVDVRTQLLTSREIRGNGKMASRNTKKSALFRNSENQRTEPILGKYRDGYVSLLKAKKKIVRWQCNHKFIGYKHSKKGYQLGWIECNDHCKCFKCGGGLFYRVRINARKNDIYTKAISTGDVQPYAIEYTDKGIQWNFMNNTNSLVDFLIPQSDTIQEIAEQYDFELTCDLFELVRQIIIFGMKESLKPVVKLAKALDKQRLIPQSGIETTPVVSIDREIVGKDPDKGERGTTISSTLAKDTCSVESISIDNMFMRDYLIPTPVGWSVSNPRFSLINQINLPQALFTLSGAAPYGALQYHALYHSDFRVKMRIDSTNFNQGILCTFAVPGVSTVYDTFTNLNYATVMNYPHVFLNVGLTNVAEFDVPYGSLYSMIPPNARNNVASAKVYTIVWSPLFSGNAPTNLSISYWIQPLDAYVGVKTTNLIAQSDLVSSIVTPALHAILGDVKKKVCYDRIMQEDNHMESGRPGDAPIVGVNTKFQRLEVIPNMEYRFKNNKCQDLMDFCRIPSLAAITGWTTSNPSGTILTDWNVSPTSPMVGAGSTSAGTIYMNHNIGGIASMFNLFRGSIDVQITIVATSFHRGTLFIAFDPYGTSVATPKEIYGLPGLTLAVGSNDNTISLRIPFTKHKDYVRVVYPEPSIDDQIGRLYVVVQNALTAPANVATGVEILMYMSTGPDAEFKSPVQYEDRQVQQQFGAVYQSEMYDNSTVEPGFIGGTHTNILLLMRRPEYVRKFFSNNLVDNRFNIQGNRLPFVGYHCLIAQLFKYNSGGIMVHIATDIMRTQSSLGTFGYYPYQANNITFGVSNAVPDYGYQGSWCGAVHNFNRDPCTNFLMPGYNEVPFFYNSIVSGATTQGWTVTMRIASYVPATTDRDNWLFIAHSVADDFMMYYPMSMFRILVPISKQIDGGLIPLGAGGKYPIVSTRATTVANVFDRNLTTWTTFTGTMAEIGVAMPVGNTLRLSSVYAFAVIPPSMNVLIEFFGYTGSYSSSPVTTLIRTFNSVYDLNGQNDISSAKWYDGYFFRFTSATGLTGVQLYEMQIYQVPWGNVMPYLTGNTMPDGYDAGIESGTVVSGQAYQVFDGILDTDVRWSDLPAGISIILPQPTVVSNMFLRGYGTLPSFRTWKLFGAVGAGDRTLIVDSTVDITGGSEVEVYVRNTIAYDTYVIIGTSSLTTPVSFSQWTLRSYGDVITPPITLEAQSDVVSNVANSAIGFVSSAMTTIRDVLVRIKEFLKSVKQLNDRSSRFSELCDHVCKFFREVYEIIDTYLVIVMAIYTAYNSNNSAVTFGSVAIIASSIYKIACPVENSEGLCEQSSDGQFDSFVNELKKVDGSVSEYAERYLSPRYIRSLFEFVCKKRRIDGAMYAKIFEREKLLNPDMNVLALSFWAMVIFLLDGNTYITKASQDAANELVLFVEDIDLFLDSYSVGDIIQFRGNRYDEVSFPKFLKTKLSEFRKKFAYVSHNVATNLVVLVQSIKKVEDLMHKSELQVSHQEPVSLYVFGDPGCGKTMLMGNLLPLIINNCLKNDETYKDKYIDFSRVPFSERAPLLIHTMINSELLKFDTNYNHQNFILVDDFLTERNTLDVTMATRLVNVAPNEVAKAKIDEKGEIYDSSFVIFTSNESDPVARASEHINSAKKLIRRMGKMVKIVKNTVDINSLDIDKLGFTGLIAYLDKNLLLEQYEYTDNSFSSQRGDRINFSQLIAHMVDEYKRKNAFIGSNWNKIAQLQPQSDDIDDDLILDALASMGVSSLDDPISRSVFVKVSNSLILRERVSHDPRISNQIKWECGLGSYQSEDCDLMEELRCIEDVHSRVSCQIIKAAQANISMHDMIRKDMNISEQVKDKIFIHSLQTWMGLQRAVGTLKQYCTTQNGLYLVAGIIAVIGTVSACQIIRSYLKKVCNSVGAVFQSVIYDAKPFKPNVDHVTSLGLVPQDCLVELNTQDRERITKLRKNIVYLQWENADGTVLERIHGLFINARTIVLNKHFFRLEEERIEKGARLKMSLPTIGVGGVVQYAVVALPKTQRVQVHENRDVLWCKLSQNWPNVSDISSFLVKGDVDIMKNAILLSQNPALDMSVEWSGRYSEDYLIDSVVKVCWINYMHGNLTRSGDCGRPYYIPGHGIAGIHSAITSIANGTKYPWGAATPIGCVPLEVVPSRSCSFEARQYEVKHWSMPGDTYNDVRIDGVYQSHHVSRRTQLERIGNPEFVRDVECNYVPTPKYPMFIDGEKKDPLVLNSQKWAIKKNTGLSLKYILVMRDYFCNKFDSDGSRLLTSFESINGYNKLGPVNMKTSSGIWSKWFNSGKKEIFDALPQKIVNGEIQPLEYEFSEKARGMSMGEYEKSFVELLDDREDMLRQGKIPPFVFLCTLKDELKSIDKVQQGKVRVFEQSSLDYVLLCRKYFGHFIDYFRNHAGFTLYHAIGRDVDGVWKQYAEGLLSNSPFGHHFDYKNFDGSLPAESFTFFRLICEKYYKGCDPVDNLVREGLLVAMQNGIHLMGDVVFESYQGNKSGNAFTDVFNSVTNVFLIWTAWISHQIHHLKQNVDLSSFDKAVKMLTYGDDVVMTVKKGVLDDGFTGLFIRDVMNELGVSITSAEKDKELEPYVTFERLTFLKRKFVEEGGVWKAPLPIADILKELKYRPRTARENPDDLGERIHNVLRFLVHHDKDEYDEWSQRLRGRDLRGQFRNRFGHSYDAAMIDLCAKQDVEPPLY